MLELINLTKRFKKNDAVKNMNMYIERGEIIGLLGPNGAGKSTAISMLSTLVEPTEGDVVFEKNSILKQPGNFRKIIGVVPQGIALYDDLTAAENLAFFARMYRMPNSRVKQRVDEVLEIIGLTNHRKNIVKTFSGGMKRRLNIGVALLHEPEFLILDEPTVGIDPQSRHYILESVKKLNRERNVTILYTSHYMEEVEYLCDRIYIMDQGNVIAVGTKEEIKDIMSAEHSISVEVEWINPSFVEQLEKEPAIHNIAVNNNQVTMIVATDVKAFPIISRIAAETEVHLVSIQINTPTLEDVFLHLTGRALRDLG